MNKKEPRSNSTLWMMVLGFFIGVIFIILGLVLAFVPSSTPFSVDNIIRLHLQYPAFWLLDILPFVFAIVFGLIGNKQDALVRSRRQIDWLNHKHSSEIQAITDKQTQHDQEYKDLESIISRGKQQWEATFDSVEDMIILTEENGTIVRCNRATGDAFQTGFRQLIGRPIDELFTDITNVGQGLGSAQKIEMKFPRLSGWYEVSNTPLMIEGQMGKIYIVRNVTDRKEALLNLDRQNQYYELLVKNVPIAIATLSQDNRIVACNPAFETLFGYPQRDAIGQDLDSLIAGPALIAEAHGLTQAVKQGNSIHVITQRKRQDGSLVDVEVFGVPVNLWGKQIGLLGLYHDVSDLVAVQQRAVAEEQAVEELVVEEVAEEEKAPETPKAASYPVLKIEGIGPVYAEKLAEIGIKTTEDLLNAGKSRKGREELVEKTDISSKLILRWVNIADLMRVPGIGEEYSELLEKAGVDTVKELKMRNPQNLYRAMSEANEQFSLVRRVPSQAEVENWVTTAKDLEPLLTY
jgi:two-component system sensor histidine kinase/response regulator